MISSIQHIRSLSLGLFLAGSLVAGSAAIAQAQNPFSDLAGAPQGQISFSSSDNSEPIKPGSEVKVAGSGFAPGQPVVLQYGETQLLAQPLVADQEGKVAASITIPAGAAVGSHPIVLITQNPYFASIANLKVSPDVPLYGQEQYDITEVNPTRGLYQSAYSAKNNAVFVTSAIGRPPVKESELVKLDADTLNVVARATPPAAPQQEGRDGAAQDAGLYAVYGVDVDDANDTVWVTNTRQNTVAVYRQSDLSLVKQFEPGTVNHARDVRVDATLGKAYSSATGTPEVVVFDTSANDVTKRIEIQSKQRGEQFSAASLSLDPAAHRLYVVSLSTSEVAVIDTQTDEIENVFAVPNASGTIGVSHDPESGRIFVAAQGSDSLVVLNGENGEVVANTPVGAGALNVVFDPVTRRAYVAARGANTIPVTDVDGKLVANLGPAPLANHVSLGKDGTIFVVDKSAGARGADADTLLRIRPRN